MQTRPATARNTRPQRQHTAEADALFKRYEALKVRYQDADRDDTPDAEQLGEEVKTLFQRWDRMTLGYE